MRRLGSAAARCVPGALVLVMLVAGTPPAVLANAEDGGSGLVRIEQAYSLPAGRPIFGLWGSFSSRTGDESQRLFRFTPSATIGLAAGFEASGSLLFEGADQKGENGYDRRIDLRRRDVAGKIRWSGPLGTTRFRVGAQGILGVGLGGRRRPGGTTTPDTKIDPGIVGMISTNIGAFDFPVRLHGNAGYWWSRDDGAFYYRDFPGAIPIPGSENADHNNVFSAGVGFEAGVRHVMILGELTTEQFQGARAEIAGSENLWMLTAGVRGHLTETIGITGALTFDVSSDDDRTAFRPGDVFPDTQLRIGLTFGAVSSRDRYERESREETKARQRAAEAAAAPPAEAPADEARAEGTWTSVGRAPAPATAAPGAASEPLEARIRELEMRLRQVELETRLLEMERRVERLEPRGDTPPAGPALAPGMPAPPDSVSWAPSDAPSWSAESSDITVESVDLSSAAEPAPWAAAAPPPEDVPAAEDTAGSPPGPGAVSSAPPAPTPSTVTTSTAAPAPTSASAAAPGPTPSGGDDRSSDRGFSLPIGVSVPLGGSKGSSGPTVVVVDTEDGPSATGRAGPAGTLASDAARTAWADTTSLDGLIDGYRQAKGTRTGTESATPRATPASEGASGAREPRVAATARSDVVLPAPGDSRILEGIDLTTTNPTARPESRAVLETLAAELANDPGAAVRITVFGPEGGGEAARARTRAQADAIRAYLVIAGARPDQPDVRGAGSSPGGARVEIANVGSAPQ